MNRTLIRNRFTRCVAVCMALAVGAQMTEAAALVAEQQQASPASPQPQDSSSQAAAQMAALPEAPDPAPQQPSDALQTPQQDAAQNPLGTAAGPATHPTGVAGTRPAGAAIAPAKQRRVRALFIRTSLIIAGCAAAGTVVALSKASPSHPQ